MSTFSGFNSDLFLVTTFPAVLKSLHGLQTVALQLPVVPYKVNCVANVRLSGGTRPEVCCCSKVLSMAHRRHYLFTGLSIQSRDGCIGEIFAAMAIHTVGRIPLAVAEIQAFPLNILA